MVSSARAVSAAGGGDPAVWRTEMVQTLQELGVLTSESVAAAMAAQAQLELRLRVLEIGSQSTTRRNDVRCTAMSVQVEEARVDSNLTADGETLRDDWDLDMEFVEVGETVDHLIYMTDDQCGATCRSACPATCRR